jgi:hypothetical protein
LMTSEMGSLFGHFGHNYLLRGSHHGLVGECFDITAASLNIIYIFVVFSLFTPSC